MVAKQIWETAKYLCSLFARYSIFKLKIRVFTRVRHPKLQSKIVGHDNLKTPTVKYFLYNLLKQLRELCFNIFHQKAFYTKSAAGVKPP